MDTAHRGLTCEAEFTTQGGIQNLLWQEPRKRAERDFGVKFSKETIVGVHRMPEWVLYYGAHFDLGLAQDTQALLRHAHPQPRLKQQLLPSEN